MSVDCWILTSYSRNKFLYFEFFFLKRENRENHKPKLGLNLFLTCLSRSMLDLRGNLEAGELLPCRTTRLRIIAARYLLAPYQARKKPALIISMSAKPLISEMNSIEL